MSITIKDEPLSADLKALLEHTRSQFQYHAKQRLDSIRYFFAAFGLVGALVAKMHIESDANSVAVVLVTFTALLFTVSFWVLDFRNAQMVETDEDALKQIEEKVKDAFQLDKFDATKQNEKPHQWRRYKIVTRILFGYLSIVLFVCFIVDVAKLLCHK
ncbi:hypothetical protein F6X37_26550 [Paraburkholderia sp. 31.1]|uniref:RipA family octameric membrane protein n=1 Tax=Paraburkholderia sp. 31.1 TaxID=2615205 RepID=UPI001654FDFD|nr:hypothetical protein [Paraburkholderia sp. 31.1]MBC8725009.1 hypothetical protein [Paraburkholderia sp. 31.1]